MINKPAAYGMMNPRAFFVAMVLPISLILTAATNASAIVQPDPVLLGIKPGAQAIVSIQMNNVQNLYGVELHISFDPKIVQVVDADSGKQGIQVRAGDWLKNGFVAMNQVDNTTGNIDFAATLLNPAEPVSGKQNAITITFAGIAKGDSPLTIKQAILATRDGTEIQTARQDGLIGVSSSGKPPRIQTNQGGDATNSGTWIFGNRSILMIAAISGGILFLGSAGVVIGAVIMRKR